MKIHSLVEISLSSALQETEALESLKSALHSIELCRVACVLREGLHPLQVCVLL